MARAKRKNKVIWRKGDILIYPRYPDIQERIVRVEKDGLIIKREFRNEPNRTSIPDN